MSKQAQGPRVPREAVHGVLLLDKPTGFTSNQVLVQAKRLLNAAKAGHTGTLDPFASGLLPLCFGEATKFSQDLLEADKTYETVVRLGVRTSTGDIEGDILEQAQVKCSMADIEAVLTCFRGQIQQVPPMHSALKRDGKALYEYAREGIVLEREPRTVHIHSLELLDFEAPLLRLRVHCSKGTYIRVLGEDIGAALGCGAHLQALRRTGVGRLRVEDALELAAFAAQPEEKRRQALAPVDALLSSFPALELDAALAGRFRQGQRLVLQQRPGLPEGRVRVYGEQGGFLGSGRFTPPGLLAPERLVASAP